ncbi:hypothetical protein [Bradyrhizobium sp. AS23.2]|uniref:hypothetical protein n=1 Tax=Bradyrhizobium sp. AS23.2 TaxID=1680155 RepID=UPI0011613323|nr:hypothetical protein [Bradyrhizobium sp. AS23.2]
MARIEAGAPHSVRPSRHTQPTPGNEVTAADPGHACTGPAIASESTSRNAVKMVVFIMRTSSAIQ